MGTYIFHEGPLPSDYRLDFEPAIFNSSEFISLQATTQWLSFYVLDSSSNLAAGVIHFHVDGQIARSPFKAPFGSVSSGETINPRVLYDFLEYVARQLKGRGVSEVFIKNPPRIYRPQQVALLETILLNQGYNISDAEPGTVIPVADTPFIAGMRHSEMLRSRQAGNAGLCFKKMPAEKLGSLFAFIAECHAEKGYHLSITLGQLQESVRRFPERYLLFAITDAEKIVAASVSIRITKQILYNFLVNHERDYNHLSPPVMLIEGTYEYCRVEKITLFDLGTSALHGKPNFSLLDFKLHMGGVLTSKFSFYKKID